MSSAPLADPKVSSMTARRKVRRALAQAANARRSGDIPGVYRELGSAVALLDRASSVGYYNLLQTMSPKAVGKLEPELANLGDRTLASRLGMLLGDAAALPALRERARGLVGTEDEVLDHRSRLMLAAQSALAADNYEDAFEHYGAVAQLRPVQMLAVDSGPQNDFVKILYQTLALAACIQDACNRAGSRGPTEMDRLDQAVLQRMIPQLEADPLLAAQMASFHHLYGGKALFEQGEVDAGIARFLLAVSQHRVETELEAACQGWAQLGFIGQDEAINPHRRGMLHGIHVVVDDHVQDVVKKARAAHPTKTEGLEMELLLTRLNETRRATTLATVRSIRPPAAS